MSQLFLFHNTQIIKLFYMYHDFSIYYIHIRTIFSSHFSWLRPRRPHVAQDLSPEARIELLEARGPHGTGGADEQKVAKMWS